MSSKSITLMLLLSFAVVSCSTLAPAPTVTPTQTATSTPTETPLPTATSTSTPVPTSTKRPSTPTPPLISAMVSSATPVNAWNGIPIMPGAITGSGDDKGYSFTVKADSKTIRAFYEIELAKQGYSIFATGEGSGNETVLMIFMHGTDTITIAIIPYDDLMVVTIVK